VEVEFLFEIWMEGIISFSSSFPPPVGVIWVSPTGSRQLGLENWVSGQLGLEPTGSRPTGSGQLGLANWVSSQKGPTGSQDLLMIFFIFFLISCLYITTLPNMMALVDNTRPLGVQRLM
jgi:hypothetical protein